MRTSFRPRIRSRHPSHDYLRAGNRTLPLLNFKSVIRFGSTTDMRDTITNGGNRVELNTINSVKNSASKLLMKECFSKNEVKTADWWKIQIINNNIECFPQHINDKDEYYTEDIKDLSYPIISKNIFGSRGKGNIKHDTAESLTKFIESKKDKLHNYIFEKFYNYNREYRLHVTKNECFYTCRKMLKRDAPKADRWYRNNDHCVWIMENNESFDKPVNWDDIVKQSINALIAVGLDFGAVDLRIQSATDNEGQTKDNPEFIVVEINSAPSFGEITKIKYQEIIPNLLKNKNEYYKNKKNDKI